MSGERVKAAHHAGEQIVAGGRPVKEPGLHATLARCLNVRQLIIDRQALLRGNTHEFGNAQKRRGVWLGGPDLRARYAQRE